MSEPSRLHFRRYAMAAPFEIILDVDRDKQDLHSMAEGCFELVEHLERQLSSYILTSDVCYINRTAAESPARIEPRLFRLLETAQRIWRETDGAFDITVGPLIRAWGFFKRQGKMPTNEELEEARARVGMDNVELDSEDRTVRFTKAGVEINLGGIGKGYVIDRVVEQLREWGVKTALVHSGQSTISALGKPPVDEGWVLGVTDPRKPGEALGGLVLVDRSMSTSGNWEQFFELDGKIYSHIIDPRTGRPAQGMLGATVTSASAAVSDALATAFCVMGVEKAKRYCEKHKKIAAVLLEGEKPEAMKIHMIGCEMVDAKKLEEPSRK